MISVGKRPANRKGIIMMTTRTLNDIMEFDHVIVVHEDGTITDAPRSIYAPEVHDEEVHPENNRTYVNPKGWAFLSGYSLQDHYAGPVMHASELIAGPMEDEIRETPGTYVAVVVYSYELDDATGWAVLRKPDTLAEVLVQAETAGLLD